MKYYLHKTFNVEVGSVLIIFETDKPFDVENDSYQNHDFAQILWSKDVELKQVDRVDDNTTKEISKEAYDELCKMDDEIYTIKDKIANISLKLLKE